MMQLFQKFNAFHHIYLTLLSKDRKCHAYKSICSRKKIADFAIEERFF